MSFTGPSALNTPTFRKIESRLAEFSPPINLREHIVDDPVTIADLKVNPLTLQGVDFTVKDPDKLITAIQNAKTGTDKAFAQGSTKPSDWKEHWALTASLLATRGIGFREPWRYYLNGAGEQLANARPPRHGAPEMDQDFAGYFGTANQELKMSALHIAVAYGKWTACNIHIDETGIAMSDPQNNLTITPNVLYHFPNELLLKSIAGEHLPTWFLDRFNLHVLSPEMNYSRIGMSFDFLKGQTYKLTLTASCALTTCPDIAYSKLLTFDHATLHTLKQFNPTLTFRKDF
jgi:hypothetical protein